jgi:ABC-type bacteriocin/lantibiotic exporter with double-glycine peptidase domain
MRLVLQRAGADCGAAALATYLEQSYEDVYLVVSSIERQSRGKLGLNLSQIIAAAKAFGVTLRRKAHPALDDDDGLLVVNWRSKTRHPLGSHLVVLGHGIIVDPADGLILPAEEYLTRERARVGSLLEAA